MKSRTIAATLFGMITACELSAAAAGVELAKSATTPYVIVVPTEATAAESYAAAELSSYLRQITGADFKVVLDSAAPTDHRIIVGPGKLSQSVLGEKTAAALGFEEFVIRTEGTDLLIVGGRPRGTLYGVYHLLDNILGVRWWTPDAVYVPSDPNLALGPLNLQLKPAFEYRDIFCTPAWDPDWAARNRHNGRVLTVARTALVYPDEKHGGGPNWGDTPGHSFNLFVSPEKYFDAHPAWYGERDGKRQKGGAQLCLTNHELMDFMTDQVNVMLRAHPEMTMVSVSQNDGELPCQCENCRKVDLEEGGPTGSLIRFVNTIAERIEKEFPAVIVETLAYGYSSVPPKMTRPRGNVAIRLCAPDQLKDWSALTKRIYLWDYMTNFADYFEPHPNLYVLSQNARYLKSNGVNGIFFQCSYFAPGTEFEGLRSWVLSRIAWDPTQDDKALVKEFVRGYYGKAAPFIQEYIDLIHKLAGDGAFAFGTPAPDTKKWVNLETLQKADQLFAAALAAAAAEPEVAARVREAYLPIQVQWLKNYEVWSKQAQEKGIVIAPGKEIFEAFKTQAATSRVQRMDELRSLSSFLTLTGQKLVGDRSVTASREYYSTPFEVYDGDLNTAWNGGSGGPEWVQKDFGTPVLIKSATTHFWSAYTSVTYKIEVSADGTNWQIFAPEKAVEYGPPMVLPGLKDSPAQPVKARYLRTTVIHAATGSDPAGAWVTMHEQAIETSPLE